MRPAACGLLLLLVGGCAELRNSSPEEVAAARVTSADPPYVALLTMVDRDSGQGAHSAILVNGSQVAMYDPAGSFMLPQVPERGDVLYGVTPRVLEAYEFFHARESTSFLEQKVFVSRAEADAVLARMETQGPSSAWFCAINSSEILRDFPQFAHVPRSIHPTRLMRAFDDIPGVKRREVFDDDVGKNIRWAEPGER